LKRKFSDVFSLSQKKKNLQIFFNARNEIASI